MPRRPAQPCAECGRPRSRATKGSGPHRAGESGRQLCRCLQKRLTEQRRRAQRAGQLAAATEGLARLDPTATLEQVGALVTGVAPGPATQTRLLALLAADPSVLTRGGSRMPKVVGEFCYAAIAAGIQGLTSPSCGRCGLPKPLFHPIDDDGVDDGLDGGPAGARVGERMCPDCYTRGHTAVCCRCGRDRPVKARTATGEPVCPRCQANTHQGECDGCGRTRAVKTSALDGRRYCRTCRSHRAPTGVCMVCGRDRRVNARTADGAPICGTCYGKTRTNAVCDQCGRLAALVVRADGRGGHPASVCARCYTHPRRRCGVCGRTRRVSLRATATSPDTCPTCYQWPIIDCSVCGRTEPGRRTTNHGTPLCFRCQATAAIDTALTGPDGQLRAELKGVRDAIVDRDRPRTILTNLTRTTSLDLLADIAADRIALTHKALDQTLDQTGSRFAVTYLRSLLVATGALPARDENLARLRRYAATVLGQVTDPEQRALLTRYARWQVIGRARPDRHDQIRDAVAHRCRDDIRTARRFLDHLTARGQTTSSCTQATLDTWLTAHPGRSGFLRWLRRGGHLPNVQIPPAPPKPTPGRFAPDDERWSLARRMLHDPASASVEDRAAACLILLYAQQAAKIAQLTVDDLSTDPDGDTYLRLGPEPLLLLPPLDALITALPVAKPFGTAHILADRRWLFAGKNAGHHIHPASLMRRMNQLGITTRTYRNAALLHLAATTPPAVFASLIGINTATAVRWTELAGGNWTTYPTARRATRHR